LSEEGVQRRKKLFPKLTKETFLLKEASVDIPETAASVREVDFKTMKIKKHDWALASLAYIASARKGITLDMLEFSLKSRFKPAVYESAMEIVRQVKL